MRKIIAIVVVLVLFSRPGIAQGNINDSILFTPIFQFTFGVQAPGGDMADRYGINFTVGGAFLVKTKTNIVLGIEGSLIFGSDIKDREQVLEQISTEDGYIVDIYGSPANITIYERGFYFGLKGGKLFPVIGPNPNSGLLVTLGLGYMQHKTRIENSENTVPQVQGDYEKGYDRLCGGPAISQFIGYMHLSNSKIANFMIGLEFQQAWTHSLRSYDFNLMGKDDTSRLDLFYGIKAAWMIPIYQKSPDRYYYN